MRCSLSRLTYPDADRIVEFAHPAPDGSGFLADTLASIPLFRIYQHRTDVFQDVAAYDYTSPGFNITGDRPEQIKGMHVSEGYFRLFGAPVILGRTFTLQEDFAPWRQGRRVEPPPLAAQVQR